MWYVTVHVKEKGKVMFVDSTVENTVLSSALHNDTTAIHYKRFYKAPGGKTVYMLPHITFYKMLGCFCQVFPLHVVLSLQRTICWADV